MKSIEVYLITDGNGAEAVKFYQDALQAEVVSLITFGEGWAECPVEQKHLIMNAQLVVDGIRLQLSDENPIFTYRAGGNMSAAIIVESVEEATTIYNKLMVDAQQIHMPLQEVPWSPAYAGFVDRFGMNWQINVELAEGANV